MERRKKQEKKTGANHCTSRQDKRHHWTIPLTFQNQFYPFRRSPTALSFSYPSRTRDISVPRLPDFSILKIYGFFILQFPDLFPPSPLLSPPSSFFFFFFYLEGPKPFHLKYSRLFHPSEYISNFCLPVRWFSIFQKKPSNAFACFCSVYTERNPFQLYHFRPQLRVSLFE